MDILLKLDEVIAGALRPYNIKQAVLMVEGTQQTCQNKPI